MRFITRKSMGKFEVKIRGPNEGLGPFPASKKCGKNHVVGPIPQITSVAIPEQHFLSSGI